MSEKHDIKWKIRAITGPLGISDKSLGEKMGLSKQCFAYRMARGFTMPEVDFLANILKVKRGDLL